MSEARGNAGNGSIARRLPGFDARHATQRARRFRGVFVFGVIGVAAAIAGAFLAGYFSRSGGTKGGAAATSTTSVSGSGGHNLQPTVTAALSASKLAAPISGSAVLPGPGTLLVILGGATTSGSLAPGVFTFDTSTSKLIHVANLTGGLENAAVAVIGGQDVVFGGSSPTALSTVQAFPEPTAQSSGASPSVAVATAGPIGALPQPRADEAAAAIGATTYVVGGDDGTNPEASVLATNDGRTFAPVANLAKAVRFPAVAAVGSDLYVFGGQVESATGTWTSIDTIQVLHTKTHRVQSIGRLPEPLSEASAVTLDGRILLVGGITGAVQSPAIGSTSSPNSASTAGTSPTIWLFSPTSKKATSAAQLPEPVAQAGVVLQGSTIWVIGGLSNSTPVTAIQTVTIASPLGH